MDLVDVGGNPQMHIGAKVIHCEGPTSRRDPARKARHKDGHGRSVRSRVLPCYPDAYPLGVGSQSD